jgi:hypothetical protein
MQRINDFLVQLKTFISVILLGFVVFCLSGCASEQALDLSKSAIDKIPLDVGRFSAHVAVRTAEEKTKQDLLAAEKAKAEADKARYQSTTISLDTPEKIAVASMAEMGRALSDAVRYLARGEGNEYKLATTPTPKGVIGETIDSIGGAVEKVASTPAALATSLGVTTVKMTKEAMRGAGDKTTVNGDANQITATKTKIDTRTQNTGEGTAAGNEYGGTAGGNEKSKTELAEVAEEIIPAAP